MRLALVLAAALLLAACSRPQDAVIPADPKDFDQLRPAIQKLSTEDQGLFARYVMRTTMGAAFGAGSAPVGVTVGQAIVSQRTFEKDMAQKEAEAAALKSRLAAAKAAAIAELGKVLTVTFIDKKYVPADPEHGTFLAHIDITLGVQNKGPKEVSGFKGTAVFTDMFGDVIRRLALKETDSLAAGAERTSSWSVDYNQFEKDDKRFAEAQTEKIQFSFEPTAILFTDGSRLEAPDD